MYFTSPLAIPAHYYFTSTCCDCYRPLLLMVSVIITVVAAARQDRDIPCCRTIQAPSQPAAGENPVGGQTGKNGGGLVRQRSPMGDLLLAPSSGRRVEALQLLTSRVPELGVVSMFDNRAMVHFRRHWARSQTACPALPWRATYGRHAGQPCQVCICTLGFGVAGRTPHSK